MTCWALLAAALVGCGGGGIEGAGGRDPSDDDDDDLGGDADADADTDTDADGDGDGDGGEGELEACNGLDDDRNGAVDEGCGCEEGARQECFTGDPDLAGVGACAMGTQTCASSFEFGEWGACEGAGSPGAEVCGNAIDDDCNGSVDEDCCVAAAEVCGDGIDQDCDGADAECEQGPIVLELDIDGDCVTASCPPEAPFPIACDIDFQGGDERGCVAYVPGTSEVYFQEGNVCNAGHLTGTLTCSTEPGPGLNADNCPINKDEPYYESDPDDCPD